VVGAGGLGCPASLYLASSGVGRLTIADADVVDLTNLQRQILYRTDSVGAAKVAEARKALAAINPGVEIVPLASRVTGDNAGALVAAADVVLDCSDNFATRHALNRACVAHRKPLVSGAAIRMDGQLKAVFVPTLDEKGALTLWAAMYEFDGRDFALVAAPQLVTPGAGTAEVELAAASGNRFAFSVTPLPLPKQD